MARILFVGEYFGIVGGVERYMARSAGILARHGHEVYCLGFRKASGAQAFCSSFEGVFEFDELLRKRPRFDFVVVHKISSAAYLKKLKELYKVVMFIHDHEYYCPRKSYYTFTRNNCSRPYSFPRCNLCAMVRRPRRRQDLPLDLGIPFLRLWREVKSCEKFIVISSFMRDVLGRQGIPSGAINLIPPSIGHYDAAPEAKEDKIPHLLVLGQLIKGKGVDQLLAALPLVKNEFVLDILGSGNDEQNLRKQAAAFGERVRFHSWSSEPEKYLMQAYAVILPWRWQEPFGLVGPEALAHDIPLIGFDVGGIREYLVDRVTGLLLPPGDTTAMAEAIDTLIDDPGKARQMGENGRKLVEEKFSEAKFMAGWDALINAEAGK